MSWNDCEPVIGRVYSAKMLEVFGPARVPRSEIEQQHCRPGRVRRRPCSKSATSNSSTTSSARPG